MNRLRQYFAALQFNRAALIESGKIVFALIGVGTILADFSTMRYWFLIPGVALFVATWFVVYTQMEGV